MDLLSVLERWFGKRFSLYDSINVKKRVGSDRIRVGETLADIQDRHKYPYEYRLPTIPPGLIVKDERGVEYITGQEESEGGQDFAGILLYDLKNHSRSQVTYPIPKEFVVVEFNHDKNLEESLLAHDTPYTEINYQLFFQNN